MAKLSTAKKVILIAFFIVLLLGGVTAYTILVDPFNWFKKDIPTSQTTENIVEPYTKNDIAEEKTIKVVDLNSKTRPYALVVNNTPVAVKVQTGLNKAYLVYEIPTEGNTSRLMALYKDVDDFTVGTIRSSRHNFIDYALESDAIFVHFGWSHYSETDQKKGSIDYINGLFDEPFWRENPEHLASEHTAYTSTGKIKEYISTKGYKAEASSAEDTILLKYNVDGVDLSAKEGAIIANKVTIPYDTQQNITTFIYDEESKMYTRQEQGNDCIDYKTKEKVTTKNIIVEKIGYSVCSDNYYWDLKTVGSGDGYYITNGYAVPIKWSKSSRSSKTVYTYLDGTEIEMNDGRTYIEVQPTSRHTTIE